MAEVKLDKIDKIYDNKVQAVFSANFTIKDREFVVLVGPSGCGKTTTLRMIAGLEDISGGTLSIGDKVVNDVAPKDRDIAMVFQNYALYPHMSVYDNMAFGLKIRKIPKPEIDQKVQDAAKILDIGEFLERKPKQLSGGQRQRVALGRAIVRSPKVFLFDEPLSNLDAKLRVQMRTEISALHNKLKATMVYVTHDQVEAMTMGDRIVIMKLGVIQQIGTPLDLYLTPINKFVAGFIGSPPMNFLNINIKKEGDEIFVDEGRFKFKLTDEKLKSNLKEYVGENITMGIRPENVVLDNSSEENLHIIGEIDIIEPLGAETHIYINTGKHQVICRVEPNQKLKLGDTIKLKPVQEQILFFDSKTEKAIGLNIDDSEWNVNKS